MTESILSKNWSACRPWPMLHMYVAKALKGMQAVENRS
jgi:hypothetical protein